MKLNRLTKLLVIYSGWIDLAKMDIGLALCHRDDLPRYRKRIAIARETMAHARQAFGIWKQFLATGEKVETQATDAVTA